MQSRAREKRMTLRGHPTEQILPAYVWADLAFEVLLRALELLKGAATAQGACVVRLRFVSMPKPWTRSKQHSLVVYARVVGAQPRRRLPVWLAHAVSRVPVHFEPHMRNILLPTYVLKKGVVS